MHSVQFKKKNHCENQFEYLIIGAQKWPEAVFLICVLVHIRGSNQIFSLLLEDLGKKYENKEGVGKIHQWWKSPHLWEKRAEHLKKDKKWRGGKEKEGSGNYFVLSDELPVSWNGHAVTDGRQPRGGQLSHTNMSKTASQETPDERGNGNCARRKKER